MTGHADRGNFSWAALPAATAIAGEAGKPGYDAVAGDGSECRIVLDRKSLIVNCDIGGLNCRISLPGSFYESVTLNILKPGYSVRLVNKDPALDLTMDCPDDLRSALELRDNLARQLRLPALTQSSDGDVSGDERKLGAIVVRDRQQRRGSQATARRPRFLARRKRGSDRANDRVSGTEIIARH